MPVPMILRGARLVDPANGVDEVRDLGLAEGLVVPADALAGARVIDLTGRVLAPGFIDMHVHLRDPGQTGKEDISSGTRAAAAGGFASVVAMPNTAPPIDSPAAVTEALARIRQYAVVRVYQAAAMSRGLAGVELTDAGRLGAAGAAALTDDGRCLQDAGLMRRALAAAGMTGIPVLDHCEDAELAASGVVHAGRAAAQLGVPGIVAAAEETMVARDAELARTANWPVHVQHLSSAISVQHVRAARAQGIPLTAEVTPHHLTLTDAACLEYGTNAKVNPPLRTEQDRLALIEGLRDGTISAIASDHAPHTAAEKDVDLRQAPFGLIGLETTIPVCMTALVHSGLLTLPELIAKFTSGPRDILGLRNGSLEPGAPADVTILDPDLDAVLDVGTFRSRSRNSPFHGWHCRGKAVGLIVAGEWVYSTCPEISACL